MPDWLAAAAGEAVKVRGWRAQPQAWGWETICLCPLYKMVRLCEWPCSQVFSP